MKPDKSSNPPPKSQEQLEADAEHQAACDAANAAARLLEASANSLKRTISGPMQAVRLPTPSQLEMEAQPPKG